MTSILLQLLIFSVSLFALIKGSDLFVDKAEKIGLSLGISPFIIGVTVVAFGTSLPELASSIASVTEGHSEIVIANVVGSNISNILLVLGLVAIFAKNIELDGKLLGFDAPMLLVSAGFLFFSLQDLHFSLIEALLFFIALVIFLASSIKGDMADNDGDKSSLSPLDFVWLIAGGVLIYVGAEHTIESLTAIAMHFMIDESFIAITMLAIGTSLPEVSCSLSAARKGKSGIAIGNILGSNIFNTYAVMSISSLFGPLAIPEHIQSFGVPFMIGATLLFYVICLGRKINLWIGATFIILYVFFVVEMSKLVLH